MTKLTYLESQPNGARKYEGDVATGYNAKREQSSKWIEEQELLERCIEKLTQEEAENTFDWKFNTFLDIPTGTGRLLPKLIEHGFTGIAMDISDDMLAEAKKQDPGHEILFDKGDVRDLSDYKDNSFDVSFMIRLTRWLSPEDRHKAIQELQRVSKEAIILTLRVNGPYAYPLADLDESLSGWNIGDIAHLPSDINYCVVVLFPLPSTR